MERSFDEIQVFNGSAQRTGVQYGRDGVRGRAGLCRSVTELRAKARRLGDGYYYLASSAWPEETETLELQPAWEPQSGQ